MVGFARRNSGRNPFGLALGRWGFAILAELARTQELFFPAVLDSVGGLCGEPYACSEHSRPAVREQNKQSSVDRVQDVLAQAVRRLSLYTMRARAPLWVTQL